MIKDKIGIKFHSEPEFNGVIKTKFLGNDTQKKICIILVLLA